MVLTRRSPEKEPPAGVPTRRRKPLSRREVVRAERAERAERRAQAMQANPPVQEDARPSTPPPLRTQPFMHTSAHVNFYACQAFLC